MFTISRTWCATAASSFALIQHMFRLVMLVLHDVVSLGNFAVCSCVSLRMHYTVLKYVFPSQFSGELIKVLLLALSCWVPAHCEPRKNPSAVVVK